MKILIAGAGAVGKHLAKLLSRENHDIVILDPNEERLQNLQNDFDLMAMVAKPTSIAALQEAGAAPAASGLRRPWRGSTPTSIPHRATPTSFTR